MKNKENASLSIVKIICVSIILVLISGIGVLAVNRNMTDVKIILQNGYELSTITAKEKVSEVLAENNIILEDTQKTVPDVEEKVTEGMVIKITDKSYNEVKISEVSEQGVKASLDELMQNYAPITEKIVVEQEVIPFETITKNTAGTDSNVQNKVLQEGQEGLKEVTYKIKYQNDIEIEKTQISEVVVKEPINKIVQVNKKVVTSRGATTSRTTTTTTSGVTTSYSGGKWSYSANDLDLLCAITAQESGSSYAGSLAVITTACNRAESSKWRKNGSDPLSQYKAKGQFCYSIDSHWKRKLNYVKQAVVDALNGKRSHSYLSFRSAGTHAGVYIGGNVYF